MSSPFVSTLPERLWDGIRQELKPILVFVSLIVLAIADTFMHNRILNNKVREPI